MSQNTANPLDPKNFVVGGGLWDGKTVTITGAQTTVDRLTFKDGKPVLDDAGNPATRNVLAITGIAEGEDRERRETYSAGGLIPTADGEGFVGPDGGPAKVRLSSAYGKFLKAISEGGFDNGELWDAASNRSKLSALVGAQFMFKGVRKTDKDGKAKVNAKGYDELAFFPVKFIGRVAGSHASKGNGISTEVKAKAQAAILSALNSTSSKTLSPAEAVRALAVSLATDPDRNSILALVGQPDFHSDAPWVYTGTSISLA